MRLDPLQIALAARLAERAVAALERRLPAPPDPAALASAAAGLIDRSALAAEAAALVPVPDPVRPDLPALAAEAAGLIDRAALAAAAAALVPVPEAPVVDLDALASEASRRVPVPEAPAVDLDALAAAAARRVPVPEAPPGPDAEAVAATVMARLRAVVAEARAAAERAPDGARWPTDARIDDRGDLILTWSDGVDQNVGRVRPAVPKVRLAGGGGGPALPAGGTEGQVLARDGAGGVAWVDQSGGSGLPDGGEAGDVLTKTADGAAWADPAGAAAGAWFMS